MSFASVSAEVDSYCGISIVFLEVNSFLLYAFGVVCCAGSVYCRGLISVVIKVEFLCIFSISILLRISLYITVSDILIYIL